MQIPFHKTHTTDEEINAAVEAIKSGWVTMGPKTVEFEKEFKAYVASTEAVSVNSATAALHLALKAIGLKRGDEVILPTNTFVATAEVVTYFDATPVLCDIEESTHNIDVSKIKKQQVQSMLKLFDACYIGLQKESLFKYGVSPNKLFDYMYSKKPIVYAIDSGKSNIVKLANCGVTVEAQNSEEIANGILTLYNMQKEQRENLSKNGRIYVTEHFTYEKLAKKFEDIL